MSVKTFLTFSEKFLLAKRGNENWTGKARNPPACQARQRWFVNASPKIFGKLAGMLR